MEESYSVQSPSEGAFSSVTQISSIQAQSQSHSLVSTGRFKRDRATLHVDEDGTRILVCNCCQSVMRVGSEEEEIPNVKLQTEEEETRNVKARTETLSVCKENPIGPLADTNEDDLGTENKILLRTVKEALIQFSKAREASKGENIRLKTAHDKVTELTLMKESFSVQSPSAGVFSSVTQIPSGSLKRDSATVSAAPLSVDEKGIQTLICNCCQNAIRVDSVEEEIENIKARTDRDLVGIKNGIEALRDMNGDWLSTEEKILLRAKEELFIQFSKAQEARGVEKIQMRTAQEALIQLSNAREETEGDKILPRIAKEALREIFKASKPVSRPKSK